MLKKQMSINKIMLVKCYSVPITLTCLRFPLDVFRWLRAIPCWCWLSYAGYSPRVKGYFHFLGCCLRQCILDCSCMLFRSPTCPNPYWLCFCLSNFLCLLADNGPCLFFLFSCARCSLTFVFLTCPGSMLLAVTLAGSLSFCFRVFVVVASSEHSLGFQNVL
jgi:hypothetical protein